MFYLSFDENELTQGTIRSGPIVYMSILKIFHSNLKHKIFNTLDGHMKSFQMFKKLIMQQRLYFACLNKWKKLKVTVINY